MGSGLGSQLTVLGSLVAARWVSLGLDEIKTWSRIIVCLSFHFSVLMILFVAV
jgi:hypothetical protein